MDSQGTDSRGIAAPRRGSLSWRYFGDVRALGLAAHDLVLQVAHPVVGAGVLEHSDYKQDPWGRFNRTYKSITTIVYGGDRRSLGESDRLRTMHKAIRGTDAQGRRYSALDPEAYAWVHHTLVMGVVDAHAMFGRPMNPWQVEGYYAESRDVGRLLGLREKDMPPSFPEFRAYFDHMVAERLEDNQAVHDVLDSVRWPKKPDSWTRVSEKAWRRTVDPVGEAAYLVALSAMPPVLRERCGLELTDDQKARTERLCAVVRTVTGLVPAPVRRTPAVLVPRVSERLAARRSRAV